MEYGAIDLHAKESQIRIIDQEGAVLLERRVTTTRARTWLYVDPQHGQIVLKEERLARANRWLYHGLHSLDFPVLYNRRPAWDIVVIVLSLGGIAVSITTLVAGMAAIEAARDRRAGAPLPCGRGRPVDAGARRHRRWCVLRCSRTIRRSRRRARLAVLSAEG